jgi:hypothetical protein
MAHCHRGLSQLSNLRGKREQAREELTTAVAMFRKMKMPIWLQKAETALNQLG